MASQGRADVHCRIVGDFIEESEVPSGTVVRRGEVIRPKWWYESVETGDGTVGTREFTFLLHDNRIITIRGSCLKTLENPTNPTEPGSFAIFARTCGGEEILGQFRCSEVAGIFHGEAQAAKYLSRRGLTGPSQEPSGS